MRYVISSLNENDPLRLKILTLAPKNWSALKLSRELNVSRHAAQKPQELKSIFGLFPDITSNRNRGRSIPENLVKKVVDFYNDDENSRIISGVKNCIYVINAFNKKER